MKIRLAEKLDDTPVSKASPEQIAELKKKVKDIEGVSDEAMKRTPISKASPEQIKYFRKRVSDAGKPDGEPSGPLHELYTSEELNEVLTKADYGRQLVDDPDSPGNKITKNALYLRRHKSQMVDDPNNPGQKIARGELRAANSQQTKQRLDPEVARQRRREYQSELIDDPDNPGSKVSRSALINRRSRDANMVEDPENPGSMIRKNSLDARNQSRQLVQLQPNSDGNLVPVRKGAIYYRPKVARVGSQVLSNLSKYQTFDKGIRKKTPLEKKVEEAKPTIDLPGGDDVVKESYTLSELNKAFNALGLDTSMYTTEYLAEELGFSEVLVEGVFGLATRYVKGLMGHLGRPAKPILNKLKGLSDDIPRDLDGAEQYLLKSFKED